MAEEPRTRSEDFDAPDEGESSRELLDTDSREDGVDDTVEAAVAEVEDVSEVGEVGPESSNPVETLVEVQPPDATAIGGSVQLAQPKKPWIRRFIPRTRRERQIQALQTGYNDMLDMMRSISTHLDRQAEVQDGLLGALEHFPDAVDSLRHVGEATQHQTEMLGLVKQRLESSASHEQQVVDSMNRFNSTLTMMDDTSKTTADTIGSLVDRSRESEESLRVMLERSERRTTLLLGFLGLLAIGAVAIALYFGVGGKGYDLGALFGDRSGPGAALTDGHGEPAVESQVVAVEAHVADVAHEAGVTAEDAAASNVEGASEAIDNLSVPELDKDLSREMSPAATDLEKADDGEAPADSGEPSDSIVEKVISTLAEHDESNAAADVQIEPVH